MAATRNPGVLCAATNAVPIDGGTLTRSASACPGPMGTTLSPELSDYDLEFVRSTAGKNPDGSTKPLPELDYLRGIHLRRHAEVTRELGPQSWSARFEQATVDRLSELIETARSPSGKASEELRLLIEEARKPGTGVTDEQMSQAVAKVLGNERQRQLLGAAESDPGGSEAMALVVEALCVSADRKNAALKQLLARARQPGSPVSDEQITKAVQDVLGHERQKQLLGAGEAGNSEAMGLVIEAMELFTERKHAALKSLINRAKVPGNAVTDEQLARAVSDVLGVERQSQLLGVTDGTRANGSMALVIEAAQVSLERKRSALARLYDSGGSETQIKQATAEYENAKAQLRQLGVAVPEATVTAGSVDVAQRPGKPR